MWLYWQDYFILTTYSTVSKFKNCIDEIHVSHMFMHFYGYAFLKGNEVQC
jgi:hypothetical protein